MKMLQQSGTGAAGVINFITGTFIFKTEISSVTQTEKARGLECTFNLLCTSLCVDNFFN